jgi:TrpR family trp operon transcriptional repressor
MTNKKFSQKEIEAIMSDLLEAIQRAAADKRILRAFLIDLLTPQEYRDTALRWRIVTLLHQGVPQRDIAARLGVSLATITRGSRELSDERGGFSALLV